MKTTTMSVSKENRDKLEALKIHPRETLNDVLTRILERHTK